MGDPTATYSIHNRYDRINTSAEVCSRMETASADEFVLTDDRFNAEYLMNEQRRLLEVSSAAEIRASSFLRLRLAAQQKLTMQHNQFRERRMRQDSALEPRVASRRPSTAQGSLAAGPSASLGTAQGPEQRNPDGVSLRCSGCFVCCPDITSLNIHKSSCREYAALGNRRRDSNASQCMARCSNDRTYSNAPYSMDMQGLMSAREHFEDPSQITDVLTARGVQFSCNNQSSIYSGAYNEEGGHHASVAVFSPKTGSRSPSHSVPTPSSSRDDRIGNRPDGRESRYDDRGVHYSREMTPINPSLTRQNKRAMSIRVTSNDEVPASVAARHNAEAVNTASPILHQPGDRLDRDFSVDEGKYGSVPYQSNVSYSNLGGAVDSLRESSEAPDEPLRPCPSCGRHFFAFSRWPRHVAVCEQKRQQSSKGTASSRLNNGNVQPVTQTPHNTSIESVSTARRKARGSFLEKGKGIVNSNVGGSAEKFLNTSMHDRQPASRAGSTPASSQADGSHMEEGSKITDDRVLCPSCGRRFATHVAERHIPHCRERSEGNRSIRL